MATVAITFGGADSRGGAPVAVAEPRASEAETSSGTSVATAAASEAGEYIGITATGGAVWATIAASPTAATGTTYLIPDGSTQFFYDAKGGNKVAVIDA